jgi:hypothetical protein
VAHPYKVARGFAGLVDRSMQKPARGCAAPRAELRACALKIGKAEGKLMAYTICMIMPFDIKRVSVFVEKALVRE